MKRILIVYNPRSSHFGQVREEVLDRARGLKGYMVGKYEVLDTDVDDNAVRLARVVSDGDLVVAAGGDGTATIAFNGLMLAGAEGVRFGVLGYGNFNDVARTFGIKSLEEIVAGKAREVWGLECLVNGKRWRWGMGYFTVGLFAEACAVFDQKDNRRRLRTGKKGIWYSIQLLRKWYFRNRKKRFLADFLLERGGIAREYRGMTDYVAVNGRSMARMMRGGEWFLQSESFLGATKNLRGFCSLAWLMMRSIFVRIPGEETRGDKLTFVKPTTVMIQAEGEYRRLEGVETIEIRKATRSIEMVMK